ncbi:hypothetical protein L228DRAFT_265090 [Xylona heveae TC161]|uniref:Arrestin C-terminal-like domain-containing protein n=1 Tax=Xylona heveae (strain CBS 132557 / TC161) TaxID=1328760 RepID=A0A165JWP3_XYLHT|nr:hypothetical protein L228DRAFT_265090 [Xylona heveae TC161]KZF26718.1 hypothetical protein L228DRAFT_265090 [Xylona heveae TC161]
MTGRTLESYTSRGRLYYLPENRVTADSPSAPFEPRRRRAQSIRITRLPLGYRLSKDDLYVKEPVFTKKLAGSRESAKRFLRSVINPPSSSTPAPPAGPTNPSSEPAAPPRPADPMMIQAEPTPASHRNSIIGGSLSGIISRPSLNDSIRTASGRSSISGGSTSSVPKSIQDEKPLASGNGISVSVSLAEPVLFLQGFDQNDAESGSTTMLRGSLHLKVYKAAKIKAISLNFRGKAITKWPEGIPPRKAEFEEIETLMNHTWPFFNAQFPTAEGGHCADVCHLAKGPTTSTTSLGVGSLGSAFDQFVRSSSPVSSHGNNMSSRDLKRLSLQLNHSRSFGKGESGGTGPTVAQKGYRMFQPGDYIYNFELPLDSRLPESIKVELGTVKYELEASVERAGAFRANLNGIKEIVLIRTPSEGSLEQVEPIAISRNWEDQLHYDIVISGKSFPLGSQIPIAFKLTPLAKVHCHRIRVYVTENIEYFCHNKRVHRMEPTRKVQLFEKRADGPSTSAYPGSSVRVTAGGGVAYDSRDAAAAGREDFPVQDNTNLLGNLEASTNIGPTEMEFSVQLPSCAGLGEKERAQRLHFDTTFRNIQVHHWIKIVMRLSKPDQNDPTKRRHFEISIDSPFHILSCRATQANIALPAYSSPQVYDGAPVTQAPCHCQDPIFNSRNSTPAIPPVGHNIPPSGGLARPQAAHINSGNVQRPIHLLRNPSFNPPPFEYDSPPPPLITPPPQYDTVVGEGDGLRDYFARIADETHADEDEEDEGSDGSDDIVRTRSRGRVVLPLTPGGRVNRSMDLPRTRMPLDNAV